MGELITFKHSFNAGDLISVLPGIKYICNKNQTKARIFQRLNLPSDYGHYDHHPIKDNDGKQVCMNEKVFEMMKPLIEDQEYVESFEVWQGEKVDFDFDLTRHSSQMPLPGGNIYYWPTLIFPQLIPDTSVSWLYAPLTTIGNRIVISRTERYLNPYIDFFFLKKYPSAMFLFLGTERECDIFNSQWGTNITMAELVSFRDASMAIRSCRFFIGNQSLFFHIAQALDIPRLLEVCASYPNTFPTNINAHPFINQQSFEFYFEKLLKETS